MKAITLITVAFVFLRCDGFVGEAKIDGAGTSTALPRTATQPEQERRVDMFNAYSYKGPSLRWPEDAKLVAVDVQIVRGAQPWSLSSLELLDGGTGELAAANADVAFLNTDGTFHSWEVSTDDKGLL